MNTGNPKKIKAASSDDRALARPRMAGTWSSRGLVAGLRPVNKDIHFYIFWTTQEVVHCHFLSLLRGATEHPQIICYVPV